MTLETANKRTFRAFQLNEELSDIFALPLLAARRALDNWLANASRSKLAPFVKLARTIRHYRPSIEATIECRLTNGIAESNNASIGRIRTNARGFHDPEASSPRPYWTEPASPPTSAAPLPAPRQRQLSLSFRHPLSEQLTYPADSDSIDANECCFRTRNTLHLKHSGQAYSLNVMYARTVANGSLLSGHGRQFAV